MAARTDLPQLETWATLSRQKSTSLPIHAGWVPCKAGFYRITHIDAERFICEGVIDHTDGTVKTIAMPIDLQMSLRASQTVRQPQQIYARLLVEFVLPIDHLEMMIMTA